VDERLPEPGWYPDPAGGSALRYWDGRRWASSSGDRLSAETGREATGDTPGDATQPIDPGDPPPAPDRADAWESYPASDSFTRGPLRPLAVVLLLVVVAGAVLAFALGSDDDGPADVGDPVADGAGEADDATDDSSDATRSNAGQDAAGDPTEDGAGQSEGGTGNGDSTDGDGDVAENTDGTDADDDPIVLDGRCEVPRDQVGDVEVEEMHAWDFDACDLAPLDPSDGTKLIVITASLPGSDVSEAAARQSAGERDLLWSSHYPALAPGYWVVYLGPFDDEDAAAEAAEEAGGGAYLRRLTGQES